MWQIVDFQKDGLANPYLLLDIARGVDFKQIDKMALDLIEKELKKRRKIDIESYYGKKQKKQ